MDSILETIGIIDIVGLVILLFFFILGLIKGFVWQIMRILTIIAGMAGAKAWSPSFSSYLQSMFSGLENSPYAIYIAYFLIFVGIFILGTLIALFLKSILKKLKLKSYDWLLGGLFGIGTGSVVIVVVLLVLLTLLPESGFRQQIETSRTTLYASWVIERAHPFIPREIQEKVKENVEKAVQDLRRAKEFHDVGEQLKNVDGVVPETSGDE